MSFMSLQVPRSATTIYGGIVAAVTTIAVSIIVFRKLRETGNKSQDKGVSKQGHSADISQRQLFIDQDAREEQNLNISIPGQASATSRPQPVVHSAGDDGQLDVSVPSRTPRPPTTSEPQFVDQDDRGNILIPVQASTTQPVDHLVRDEGQPDISVPSHPPPTTSESQFINQDARNEPNPDISISAQACILQPHEDMGSEEVPSISFSQWSSNVQISKTNANAILNGDGQFTKIQKNLIVDCIANLPNINNNLKEHVLTPRSIALLPRAEAGFRRDDQNKKRRPCFKGTRVALLREMADCVTGSSESRMYVLSGLAGMGKSTVAYTIASRAADLNLLGASFCFSRDEADCNNAKRFFTTIAYQLCVYDETFAKAIGDVLETGRGSAATTKDPQHQLQALILNPLRNIAHSRPRPILIVVDALDECDEKDALSVLAGLRQLVRCLPPFRVILTTRPQPYFDRFWSSQDDHEFFRLQEIGGNVVDGDIRLYLVHNLSMKQVQKCCPMREWCASDDEIDSLVCATGELFIIASTAVRYILDKKASNPAIQIQKLLRTSTQGHTPFKDLDHLYTIILRDVVPEDCDDNDIVSHYQSVVGAIIFVQCPLPVSTLAHLIGIDVKEIHAVFDNLQSVIFLDDGDVPRIYHRSFREYLTDQARCKDLRLRHDPRIFHMQIVTRCFEIMNKYLKRNILGLGDPARFMSNEDGLKEDGITDEQLQEKIPQVLRYACVYWVNHLELTNVKDADLMSGLAKFADEQMLYWLEVLSLIGKLDSAHCAIAVVLKLLVQFAFTSYINIRWKANEDTQPSTSSDLHQLLSDALRFISKFYEIIKRSALHTYYSVLPFTPTDSLLYHRYIKEAEHKICVIEGGPEIWDRLVAHNMHRDRVQLIKFSHDSTLLASCSYGYDDGKLRRQGKSKIWGAATGTHILTVPGDWVAVANDLSKVASYDSKGTTITFYNVNGTPSGTMLTTGRIQHMALSSNSSRVAALSDRTVWLLESRKARLINSFQDGLPLHQLKFSPTGTRLAYPSFPNGINLRDGISGRLIANLKCGRVSKFEFSGDSTRIASLCHEYTNELKLWNSKDGALVAVAKHVLQNHLAISPNGALLATAYRDDVTLWREDRDHLTQIKVLKTREALSIALSLNILAFATKSGIKLYNVNTDSFIHTFPIFATAPASEALAFSPDCTRLAIGTDDGNVNLWDIRGIDASEPHSKATSAVLALALSRDCSRLACGFGNGTVELWSTSPTKRRIASDHNIHWYVSVICFSLDGALFASGWNGGTIKLWNGEDGSLRGTLKARHEHETSAMAFSNSVLVAAGDGVVTLWSLGTLYPIRTFEESIFKMVIAVSIAENNALIAVAHRHGVSLLDAESHGIITTFDVLDEIHTMTFLPDNRQLVAQSKDGISILINLINKHVVKGVTLEHLIQLPNMSLCHGVPIWHCLDNEQHCFTTSISQHKNPVPILWIPRHIPVSTYTQGLSIIALGCWDGRIILLRLPTTHVG